MLYVHVYRLDLSRQFRNTSSKLVKERREIIYLHDVVSGQIFHVASSYLIVRSFTRSG